MKKVILILALAAFTVSFAQENQNKKTETVTTKTAVKDSKGVNVVSKDVTQTETQVIDLENSDMNKTNQDIAMAPVQIRTNVSYNNEGVNYMFEQQKVGYRMMTGSMDDNKEFALLRPSSQKGYYILSREGNSSFGYFDQNGNFVVEQYDPKSDAIITTTYSLQMKGQKIVEKNKM